ncbi:MAG TPA: cation:proton antiporter [Burkholderiales bacterium]
MSDLSFLPALPFVSTQIAWFGALLLAGIAGGQIAERAFRLPRITGYAAAGLALGPNGVGAIDIRLLQDLHVLADVSIGLILFDLGQHLDLQWLRRAPRLALTSLAECGCVAVLGYFTLHGFFEIEPLQAATAAAIGVATSPAAVMRITPDLGAQGQVTQRSLLLTALNSSVAVLALTALVPWLYLEYGGALLTILLHPLYLLAGSFLLGLGASAVTLVLARVLRGRDDVQLTLLIGLILVTVGMAIVLKLSVLLALFAYGALLRNLDRNRIVSAVDFGLTGQMFFVILFVLSGANLDLGATWTGIALGASFALARFVGKVAGVMAFIPGSGLKPRQGLCLAASLAPMSGFAVVMLQDTQALFPEFGRSLFTVVLPAVVLMEIFGPIFTQVALKIAGEARPEPAGRH